MLFSDVKWKFHYNYHMQYRGASDQTRWMMTLMTHLQTFCQILIIKKTSEELLFDSKVYHAKELFVRIRTDI